MRGGMPSDRSIKGNSDYKVQTGILYFVIPAGRPPAGGPGGPGGPGFSPRLCGASRCLKHRISVCHHHRAPRIGSTRFACQNGGCAFEVLDLWGQARIRPRRAGIDPPAREMPNWSPDVQAEVGTTSATLRVSRWQPLSFSAELSHS